MSIFSVKGSCTADTAAATDTATAAATVASCKTYISDIYMDDGRLWIDKSANICVDDTVGYATWATTSTYTTAVQVEPKVEELNIRVKKRNIKFNFNL